MPRGKKTTSRSTASKSKTTSRSKTEFKPRMQVFVLDKDGDYYKAKVTKVVGTKITVRFEDGEEETYPKSKILTKAQFDALDDGDEEEEEEQQPKKSSKKSSKKKVVEEEEDFDDDDDDEDDEDFDDDDDDEEEEEEDDDEDFDDDEEEEEDDEEEEEEDEEEEDEEEEDEEEEEDDDDDDDDDEEEEEESDEEDDDEEDDEEEGSENWYGFGDSEDEKFEADKTSGTWRFRLKKKERALITILSEQPITFREHAIRIGGNFNVPFTCVAPMGKRCPLCENGDRSYKAKGLFIVNHSDYTNKKGETSKDNIQFMVLKSDAYNLVRESIVEHFGKEKFSWKGLKLSMKRSGGKTSYTTGDIIAVKGKSKVKSEWLKTKGGEKIDKDLLIKEIEPLSLKELKRKAHLMEEKDAFDD